MTTSDLPDKGSSFTGTQTAMYVLAALVGIAGAITGILLATHSVQACTPNPYNGVFGTDLADCHATHPLVGSGLGLVAGALVNAFILLTVGRLCGAVDQLRAARSAATA